MKFLYITVFSILAAFAGTFVVYYTATYIIRVPGTYSTHFRNIYNMFAVFFGSTPWAVLLLIAAAFFVLAFFLMSQRTIRRLNEISKSVNKIAVGDYNQNLPVKEDEIGRLANDVNSMAYQIKQAFAAQKAAEQSKDELITNIAHDLRTPLTSIIGYLILLNEGNLEAEKVKHYANIAYQKSVRMEKLVEDLFEYTRLASGYFHIEKEKISLNRFIAQFQDEYAPLLAEREMELRLFMPNFEVEVYADGNLLARVFENLLNNACQYSPEGKYIDIQLSRESAGALISVITHANPIPADKLEKIFDRLYRLDASRTTKGTGLGLPISRSIVEAHQGRLTARSTGDGTAFDIWLPAAGQQNTAAAGKPKASL
jgi:signal transduction histidine kinase